MRISSSSFSFGLPLMLLLAVVGAQNEDCVTVISTDCNHAACPPNSNLWTALVNIIHDLEANTASGVPSVDYIGRTAYYYENYIPNLPPDVPGAYGQGICDTSLSSSQCSSCIANLFNCIWNACGFPIGARAQQGDYNCVMRYETYQFY